LKMRAYKETELTDNISYRRILWHNLRSNGPGGLIYSYGLSAARYIEYSRTLQLLKSESPASVLDIGSGHSLLPSLLVRNGYRVNILDVNPDSIDWQKARMGKHLANFEATVASALELPFEDGSFPAVTCISVVEHIRDDGDILAIKEIRRVLKNNGVCIVSTGVSPEGKYADWSRGIPPYARLALGERRLKKLFKAFYTDRGEDYFERFYALDDVVARFGNLGFTIEYQHVYWDWRGTKTLYQLVPMGSVTLVEYALARVFTAQNGRKRDIGTIILKLRKV
jgi:ubiquinone/menaquinone biosynthesis C-methylase UbiE